MLNGLSTVDYVILFAYLAGTVVVGSRFAKRQRSLEDYFVAGRAVPWWAAGISIITADLSAISYLGAPAWTFEKDLQYAMGIFLFPLIMLLVVYLFVPFLARLRLFTIYEYLEHRFSPNVHTFGSALFLLLCDSRLAIMIYASSLALAQITGMPLWEAIWLVGGVTTLYTVLGGMEAVIWTDVLQFFVLVGSILAMVVALLAPFHGNVGEVWRLASLGGHTRMVSLRFDLTSEVTVWALICGSLVINLSVYGSDQVVVQRYLATGSRREMARALLFNGVLIMPVMLLLYGLGLGFAAYYQVHPALRATLTNAQQVLPHFVTHVLPTGMAGLVIAGMFAATMASLACGLNSLSTSTVIDFYRRFRSERARSSEHEVKVARWCTLVWGIGSTVAALLVGRLGSIVEIMGKVNGFFTGPLLGLFLLGILSRRATSLGALSGALLGVGVTWLVTYTPVSWLWYGPAGCLITMVTGYALSYLSPALAAERVIQLTVWAKSDPEAG